MEPASGVFVLLEKRKFGWFTYWKRVVKIVADDVNTFRRAVETVPGTVILDPDTDALIKEVPAMGEETE